MTPNVEGTEFDVAIVGAGIAGALIGWKLATAGARVVFLESGPRFDRSTGVGNAFSHTTVGYPTSAYPDSPWAPIETILTPDPYYDQVGPNYFESNYERLVGGSTWHWLGTSLRLVPSDFRMRTTYGVGADWPITYDDLEPWYLAAERTIGVAGNDDEDNGAPRSGGYPMPPIPMTWSDNVIREAVEPLGYRVTHTPQARVSVREGFNGRPQCCGNAFCIPMCPIGAKYDATVHIGMAEDAGALVIDSAVVHDLDTDADGRITRVTWRRPDGSDAHLQAKVVVVAANGIETPKLLMLAANGQFPNGIANSSDQVGRNLSDHPTQLSYALARDPLGPHRSPLSTAGIENLRDGEFRRERSSYRIELGNDGWSWPGLDPVNQALQFIEEGHWGRKLYEEIAPRVVRMFRMAALCEQLPNPDSRVTLSDEMDAIGLPRPRLNYVVDDYTRAGLAAAQADFDRIFEALGATEITHLQAYQGAGHVMGTYRMGDDPASSVTDSFGRTWDHHNLWLAGSGLFPTTGTANPTLTIAALALRTAAAIAEDLGVTASPEPVASPAG